MTRQPEGSEVLQGMVVEALANAHFRIQLDKPSVNLVAEEGDEKPIVIGYLAGKMRLHRIRIIVGDRVEVLVDKYGGKPRIIRRL